MITFELCESEDTENTEHSKTVVRLKTSYWHDLRGIHQKKSLTFLRKQCQGFNLLSEDCSQIGVDYVMNHIENLYSCEDGVYEVRMCNVSADFETGYIDEYDYMLHPL